MSPQGTKRYSELQQLPDLVAQAVRLARSRRCALDDQASGLSVPQH